MKIRFFLLFVAALTCNKVFAVGNGVPTLVQAVNCSLTQGTRVSSYTIPLPNLTLSGNAIVAAFNWSTLAGVSAFVTDDVNNYYSSVTSRSDGNQVAVVYISTNCIAGASKIIILFTVTSLNPNFVSGMAAEFYNVGIGSVTDAMNSNTATSANIFSGTLNTQVTGDLIFQYAIEDSVGNKDVWVQGSTWTFLTADYWDAAVSQYQIQPAPGVMNPKITMGASRTFNSIGVAFKAADQGTAPTSGIHIQRCHHYHTPVLGAGTYQVTVPATGNLVVIQYIGGVGDMFQSTDTFGNFYSSAGPQLSNGGSGSLRTFWSSSTITSSSMSITITVAVSGATSNLFIFDITGAAAAPFDTVTQLQTTSGNQVVDGPLTTVSITPSTPNSLILTQTGVNSHTLISVTPGIHQPTHLWPDAATGVVDNNNGWAVYNSPTASAATFIYGTYGGAIGTWASSAIVFLAAPVAASAPSRTTIRGYRGALR